MIELNPLRAAIRSCLAELPPDSIGVIAVSGGPDSVALLRAMPLEAKAPIVVAHLNHQLRGEESDADEAFVAQLHGELMSTGANLTTFKSTRLDVRAAAIGDNLESTARRLRYDWLVSVAQETGASWIATGHTADDQAETILHRILRGTGLRGLGGIPPRRQMVSDILLVRPLLNVRRCEVLAFLKELGQSFRQDSTNLDRQYTRAKLRHDLLPQLASQYNPAIVESLLRLAEQAGDVQEFVESQAKEMLVSAELPRAGSMIVLNAQHLGKEPPVLVRETLRLLWERENWSLGGMGFEDWRRVMRVVAGKQPVVDLPDGLRVRRVGHVVQINRRD